MASSKLLYADEHIPPDIVSGLLSLGHDVLSMHVDCGEAGGSGWSDESVLQRASQLKRAVLTQNRKDFMHLHKASSGHYGIIILVMPDNDPSKPRFLRAMLKRMVKLIDREIRTYKALQGQVIRIPPLEAEDE